jgi:FkbM family methyltransferase
VTIADRVARAAVRRHAQLRRGLPRGYHAYPGPGGWIYLDLRESPMMLARVLRQYEAPKVRALRAVLRPGEVFVDVGGNKGDFALLAARLMGDHGRVLCFEPEPDNAAWIKRSAQRNHYASIEVLPVALAEADGTATLHLGEKSGWHSLLETEGVRTTGALEVPTRRLDDVLAERGIARVDAIKIDVEGAEDRVLAGAERTFTGSHRMTVLLDLHPGRGVDPAATCARLEAFGFGLRDPNDVRRPMPGRVDARTRSILAVR